MPRSPKRSRDDETGRLLVRCGQTLVRTGTPIEQLTLTDAVELASHQTNSKISIGRAYPRFGDQEGFRRAVLEAFLNDGPSYSDLALDGVSRGVQELGDGKSEVLEPEDVPALIARVAAEHEQEMREDTELPLRLYAIWRLRLDASERSQQKLTKLREREELINHEWGEIVRSLARELGAAPLADLEYTDFEIALTALRTGLLAREATTGIPEGILERLVGALVLGFFEEKNAARKKTVARKLGDFFGSQAMRQHQRKAPPSLTAIRDRTADSVRRLSPISEEDLDAATSPAVRRALHTLREQGKGL